MIGFLLKKGFVLLVSLWCVVTGTFFLMHAIPGDPFVGERALPKEVLDSLHAHFGLSKPLATQYFLYVKSLLRGDLGPSIAYQGKNVNQLIQEGFWISARLGLQALVIAVPVGILIGTWAALKRNRWQDHAVMALATTGVVIPNFALASLLQYIFSIKLHILPVARWGDWEHTILPTLALAALPVAFIARLTRMNMIEAMQQDYICTAVCKGLSLFRIALRHGLRNALLPVVAYLGPMISHILTGSFMIEKIFAIPGLGQWMVHSIGGRDYPMIMGLTIFFTSFLLLMVFLVDITYALLDPRIRIKQEAKIA